MSIALRLFLRFSAAVHSAEPTRRRSAKTVREAKRTVRRSDKAQLKIRHVSSLEMLEATILLSCHAYGMRAVTGCVTSSPAVLFPPSLHPLASTTLRYFRELTNMPSKDLYSPCMSPQRRASPPERHSPRSNPLPATDENCFSLALPPARGQLGPVLQMRALVHQRPWQPLLQARLREWAHLVPLCVGV